MVRLRLEFRFRNRSLNPVLKPDGGETPASDRLNSTKRRTQTITSKLDNYVHDQQ
jgi:hypothetical protein